MINVGNKDVKNESSTLNTAVAISVEKSVFIYLNLKRQTRRTRGRKKRVKIH
jgi:hypothetical protein